MKWILAISGIAGLVVGSLAASWIFPRPKIIAQREDIVLGRSNLRSNLTGQPLSVENEAIIIAKRNHPAGHVVSSSPTELLEGEYVLEMDVRIEGPTADENACIMDLLAGDKLVRHKPVSIFELTPRLRFKSPHPNGSKTFVARLYCDGRNDVQVREVKFIRNPDGIPAVVYQ